MKVGVLAVQGAVSEHIDTLRSTFKSMGIAAEAVTVRRPRDMEGVMGLIIPGGESTTISALIQKFGLSDLILEKARGGMPIMGTCAGLIVLASEGDEQVQKTDTKLLGLMEMAVNRNAFGRQKESFEAAVDIAGLDEPFHAIFIRAPAITGVWGDCELLATFDGKQVMARQKNILAMAFHPELSGDTRVHEMFLGMVLEYAKKSTE